jgi:plastocyanin
VVAIGVVGIVGFGSRLASASGGGGCGRVVTDAHGTKVRIHSFCFTPAILRIRPGQTVTWVNRDPFSHTVMGANAVWGSFSEVAWSVTYRFVHAGVYPYVCTIHPGMVGAIVVGSGNGLGDARTTTTEAGPVTLVTSRRTTRTPRRR